MGMALIGKFYDIIKYISPVVSLLAIEFVSAIHFTLNLN